MVYFLLSEGVRLSHHARRSSAARRLIHQKNPDLIPKSMELNDVHLTESALIRLNPGF